ncbi:MAG TPA: OadG family protein [Cyclobacteriaceae bacterium]|jgi:oxaloacetate decarboxylase gamma subunit
MPSSLNTAITLMVIGMTTVFFILALVVGSGKTLILFVNRFFPAEKVSPIPVFIEKSTISKTKMAVIIAVVEKITKGEGQILDIKKLNNGPKN